MHLHTTLFGKTYRFQDIKQLLGKANEEKSGDRLAGLCAETAEERVAAKIVLSEVLLSDLRSNPVVPYEEDEITRVIDDAVNEVIYNEIKHWSVGELREYILKSDANAIRRLSKGLTSEMIAAVTKLMSNMDLIYSASKLRVVVKANDTIGLPGTLSIRLQPNHPTDDTKGIVASILDGLSYGAGDAVIGINPVIDSVEGVSRLLHVTHELIQRWHIPTQNCLLAHVTTQMKAIEQGAPVGLIFQSLAGTEKALNTFGVTVRMLDEAYDMGKRYSTVTGPNMMYFETGEGSELSAEAHLGVDELTLEARCYGLAKHYEPLLVNTVVGFIGPEYLYNGRQITRAGLEDHFMGKLHGISMGCDACYTNHADADQNDNDNLMVLLTVAGCTYFMGVPMGDDCMLNYQCTSFHDGASLRETLGLRPAPEFERWMEKMGLMEHGKLTSRTGDASVFK
jgi:ethanolamine ammonia-lyase large subunit